MLTVVCSSSSSLTENQTFSLVSFARPWVHYGKDLCDQLAAIGLALPKGTKMTNKSLDERVNLTDIANILRGHHICALRSIRSRNMGIIYVTQERLQAVQQGNLFEAMDIGYSS